MALENKLDASELTPGQREYLITVNDIEHRMAYGARPGSDEYQDALTLVEKGFLRKVNEKPTVTELMDGKEYFGMSGAGKTAMEEYLLTHPEEGEWAPEDNPLMGGLF